MSAWCATVASQTAGEPVTVSEIRSLTSSPASRRACCTARTTSRATPSAASSGVTSVSRTTNPPPGRTAVAREPGRAALDDGVEGVLALDELEAHRSSTVPSSATDQSPDLRALDRGLHLAAEARPGGAGVDGELLAHAEVAVGGRVEVEQRDLADVDLVGDDPGEVLEGGGAGHDDGEVAQRQAHPQPLALAQRRGDRADDPGLVHALDELVVARAARRASGQSVRCTERSAGEPAPDLLGDERQQRRGDAGEDLERRVERVERGARVGVGGRRRNRCPRSVPATDGCTSWSARRRRQRTESQAPATSRPSSWSVVVSTSWRSLASR